MPFTARDEAEYIRSMSDEDFKSYMSIDPNEDLLLADDEVTKVINDRLIKLGHDEVAEKIVHFFVSTKEFQEALRKYGYVF
jgi:hypothetical protein